MWPVRSKMIKAAKQVVPLHHHARVEATIVLVASKIRSERAGPRAESRSAYSEGRLTCTPSIVSAEPSEECSATAAANSSPSRAVAILELHARGADRVARRDGRRPLAAERLGDHGRFSAELLLCLRRGAVADARRRDIARSGARRPRCRAPEATHRQPDDVGPLDPQSVKHRQSVGDRPLLGVGIELTRDVRRRVAARRVDDGPIATAEMVDLGLPAPVISGELVDEQDRVPAPCCST